MQSSCMMKKSVDGGVHFETIVRFVSIILKNESKSSSAKSALGSTLLMSSMMDHSAMSSSH